MRFGKIVHVERGTSGTWFRVRKIVGSTNELAITVGRGKDAVAVATIARRNMADVSVHIDNADEEVRCLLAEARAEFGVR